MVSLSKSRKGKSMVSLGPNGAGKTTTIRCMMDFLRPDDGQVTVFGKDAQADAVEIRQNVGFLPGEVHLYKNWTGKEHIDYVLQIRGVDDGVDEFVKTFKLDTSKKAGKLSSGNKQKLSLILALMHDPKLLILDEPTDGLDPLLQRELYKILRARVKKGTTVFFSSHNLPEVEKIADRVCILKEGKVVSIESIKDIRKKRIYSIRVEFKDSFNRSEFEEIEGNGVEITEEYNNTLTVNVKGDITKVLKTISKHDIADLEILHGSLEDTLFEFYK